MHEHTRDVDGDGGARSVRSLLRYGVIAGPFYLGLGVLQGLMREGFDFSKHPLSVLANGPGGWIQTATFLLSGLMVIAVAIGMMRVTAPRLRASSWLLAAFGMSMFLAAFFPADPMDGFPVGTPVGPPTKISTTGMMHFIVGGLGFVSLALSGLAAARPLSRVGARGPARFSLFTGIAVLVGFFGGVAIPAFKSPVLGIWFAVVVGWIWIAVLSRYLDRATQHA
jgi:hypothetical protein